MEWNPISLATGTTDHACVASAAGHCPFLELISQDLETWPGGTGHGPPDCRTRRSGTAAAAPRSAPGAAVAYNGPARCGSARTCTRARSEGWGPTMRRFRAPCPQQRSASDDRVVGWRRQTVAGPWTYSASLNSVTEPAGALGTRRSAGRPESAPLNRPSIDGGSGRFASAMAMLFRLARRRANKSRKRQYFAMRTGKQREAAVRAAAVVGQIERRDDERVPHGAAYERIHALLILMQPTRF